MILKYRESPRVIHQLVSFEDSIIGIVTSLPGRVTPSLLSRAGTFDMENSVKKVKEFTKSLKV
jgi:hypothetical protein